MAIQTLDDETVTIKQGVTTRRRVRRLRPIPFVFIVPAAVFYLFVVLWPSLQGFGLAFTDWDGISPTKNFVGFSQFAKALTNPDSLGALIHSVTLALVITLVQNTFGLLMALGLNSRIKSRNFLRVLLFAPAVITPVAAAYIWQFMLTPDGVINTILRGAGLGGLAQNWLGNADIAIFSIAAIVIWEFSGYSMVIFLAGLQGVPAEVVEAAKVDGAGAWRRFWYVVWPELTPALTVNLMLSVIAGLKLFDQVQVTTAGGPGTATETFSTAIYRTIFSYGQFGYGVAMAVIMSIFVAIVSAIQYRGLRKGA